ncbi:MAG: hypothetical protein ACXVHX_35885 [Solirubrobacteraceae bacterium]
MTFVGSAVRLGWIGGQVFGVASGAEPPAPPGLAAAWSVAARGAAAATVSAQAIRDAVRRSV